MARFIYFMLLLAAIGWNCIHAIETNVSLLTSGPKLQEGSPCIVKDSLRTMNGTCTSLFRCTTAARAYINSKFGFEGNWPPVTACAYQQNGEPIVCCIDCKLDDTEKLKGMVLMESFNTYSAKGSKAWIKCTEYYASLPYRCRYTLGMPFWSDKQQCASYEYGSGGGYGGYGGFNAKINEFPHMALIGYGAERESAQWLCGGSIISERFILSAAHCASPPSLGKVTFAALGILKRTDLIDYWRVYAIKTIIKHPEYRSPSKYHDIMLLETVNEASGISKKNRTSFELSFNGPETEEMPRFVEAVRGKILFSDEKIFTVEEGYNKQNDKVINFGKSILPACLDTGRADDDFLTATGWGRQGPKGALENHLQVMELQKYKDALCTELFSPHRLFVKGYDNATQMCYGRADKIVDTCEGDSGGPLQQEIGNECYYHILGITSFGKDCGIPGNAGIYTRVRYYVPWIESVVWKDD